MAASRTEAVARPFPSHSDGLIAGALLLLGLVAAGVRFNDQLGGLTGDNASYILLARDLVTGAPYGNAGFPWGFPALLTPILAVTRPDNILAAIPWLKALSILLFVLSLPLMYALFRTRQGALASFTAAALFAVNNTGLLYATDVMTEMPYTFASFGALLYWQLAVVPRPQDCARPFPWRQLLIASVLLTIPYYLRTVGLALQIAAVLTLLWRRRFRLAVALGAGLALLALPWLVFSSGAGQPNYVSSLLLRDPYNPSLGQISSLGELLARIWSFARLYITDVFPRMLLPSPTPGGVLTALAPALVLLLAIGLVLRLLKGVELPEVYVLLFLLVLFAWPWTGDRFLLPVYPLLLHYVLEAITWFAKQVKKRWCWISARTVGWQTLAGALIMVAVLPNLWLDGAAAADNARYLAGNAPASGYTPDWQRYFDACRWLRERTPPGSVVLSRKSTITEIFANRPSVLIPLIPPGKYPDFLRRNQIDYILEDAFPWSVHTVQYLRPALGAYPQMFQLVQTTAPPITRIWKVIPSP